MNNFQGKIFISHSSMDKLVVELLKKFLVNGIGIHEDQIFYSSDSGDEIPVGQNFNTYILSKLKQSEKFYTIAIISNVYYNSKYCLYELGVAWGLGHKKGYMIPFFVEGMHHGALKDFINYSHAVTGDKLTDINRLSNLLKNDKALKRKNLPLEKYELECATLITGIKSYNENRASEYIPVPKQKLNTKIKVVAFDFDGTILQGNNYKHSWKEIWEYLNYDASKRLSLQDKHRKDPKNYSFKDWCDECVSYFKLRDFQKRHVNAIIEARGLKIATNFVEVVNVLNALGIKTIIISGGIDTFITETIKDDNTLQLLECYVNKFLFDKEGYLQDVIPCQEKHSDSVGKVKILEKYCKENDIELYEVAFVGDEVNDIDILKVVGKAIVYPANTAKNYLKHSSLGFELLHEESLVHLLPKILS